jgi:hypothetical protein
MQYFLNVLQQKQHQVYTIQVDEDGDLARNFEFTHYLLQHNITLETTGGYAFFLYGKVERPHKTTANIPHALLFNSAQHPDKWCYAADTAADIYRFNRHSALGLSPYKAWYNKKPHTGNIRVCGCSVHGHFPSPSKSESRVQHGYFMGFTKSRLLI